MFNIGLRIAESSSHSQSNIAYNISKQWFGIIFSQLMSQASYFWHKCHSCRSVAPRENLGWHDVKISHQATDKFAATLNICVKHEK